jgi:hypothetical protein
MRRLWKRWYPKLLLLLLCWGLMLCWRSGWQLLLQVLLPVLALQEERQLLLLLLLVLVLVLLLGKLTALVWVKPMGRLAVLDVLLLVKVLAGVMAKTSQLLLLPVMVRALPLLLLLLLLLLGMAWGVCPQLPLQQQHLLLLYQQRLLLPLLPLLRCCLDLQCSSAFVC